MLKSGAMFEQIAAGLVGRLRIWMALPNVAGSSKP